MTNKEAVLAYLKFKPLTTFEAFAELGVTRLAAVVSDLKKDGHIITSKTLKKTNRNGAVIYFSEYKLEETNGQRL